MQDFDLPSLIGQADV